MNATEDWIAAGSLAELRDKGAKVVKGGIAVFFHEDEVYAIDNRCPHLGFPLHMGSLCDGILTCHWHHARFDICGGGTLDPWADDVASHEVECRDGEVWVNPRPRSGGGVAKYRTRLEQGLQQNIGIVIAKAIVGLAEAGAPADDIVRAGIAFGVRYGGGWHAGLTILTAMARVLPKLDKEGQILALYQGMHHVAGGSSGRAERHLLGPLPSADVSGERLIAWYRNCIEVRDTQGAERVLLTAIRGGMPVGRLTDMMLIAATDHFYLDGGHTLDFHNKAFEALAFADSAEQRERILASLVPLLRNPTRSEELHPWQAPVDLVGPLREAFRALERAEAPASGAAANGAAGDLAAGGALDAAAEERLLALLLGDRPLETIAALSAHLEAGVAAVHLARIVALAAAERICRFHTQNDFADWIAVLHTFTYAHAAHETLRRSRHPLLTRAVYHGAVAVYLDRFLNVPAAARPKADALAPAAPPAPAELLQLLDKRQQVAGAARWTAGFLRAGGSPAALINALGHALLREDADFHTFQLYEAAVAEYEHWDERNDPFAQRAQETMLLAATRYLAAHAPTARELPHAARIAWRLHKGEKLFEEG